MMEQFKNITPEQRKFLLFGGVSLIAVGIVLFLLYGLSRAEFQQNETESLTPKQVEKQHSRIEEAFFTMFEEEYARILAYREAVNQFGTSSPFATVLEEREYFFGVLEDHAKEKYDITFDTSTVVTKELAATLPEACGDAMRLEEDIDEIYSPYIEELYIQIDVQAPLFQLREQSRKYLQSFDACANA